LVLGRLESSEEFKTKQPLSPQKKIEIEIESLKITVRDLNDKDIKSRKLDKKTKGSIILELSNRSPLSGLLSIDDIIIEVQKNPIKESKDIETIVNSIIKKGEKTLLLTIINRENQRRYLGVKIN